MLDGLSRTRCAYQERNLSGTQWVSGEMSTTNGVSWACLECDQCRLRSGSIDMIQGGILAKEGFVSEMSLEKSFLET